MNSVIKKQHLKTISATFLLSLLGACASYRDIPPNSSLTEVERIMGKANQECPLADGGRRMVWTTQPMGRYAYGANVSVNGVVDKVSSVLTDEYFKRLNQGVWSNKRVLCEFGPPAEIDRVGLGNKNEEVWTYRYKQNKVWNSLMYVYMGYDGQQVTHFHPGPDPLYERSDGLFPFMR